MHRFAHVRLNVGAMPEWWNGRQRGLKIPCELSSVRVRVPSPAPHICGTGGMEDALVLGTSVLCVWVRVPRPAPTPSSVQLTVVGLSKYPTLGRANGTIRKSNVRLVDLKTTGNQTSKCSEKQYKYEEKMCGSPT